jgi:hypothetical protein
VERRERLELLDRREHAVVDQGRLHEAHPAVHDPVTNRFGGLVSVDGPRFLAVDEVTLQARRAGIDSE